jgi:Flp pilus assembly protein TadB
MALTGERTEAMRDDARHMRESVRRENIEEKLEGVVKERPGVRPFLDLRPLAIAVGIAAVLTLITALLLSVTLAAVVLVVSFAIAWVALSKTKYEKREQTKDIDEVAEERDSDPAPYSG